MNRIRLLIVDDDPSIANIIRELLWSHDRECGKRFADIEIASDLKRAVYVLTRSHSPVDVCLCDGNFPIKDGQAPGTHWADVASLCHKLGVQFLLHSGDERAIQAAGEQGDRVLRKLDTSSEQMYAAVVESQQARAA